MNLANFRKLTQDLPGETELVVWYDEECTWRELVDRSEVVPPTPIHPQPVLVLDIGQVVELELDMAVRTGIDDDWRVGESDGAQ